jgi:predicted nucleic acid-binding protein
MLMTARCDENALSRAGGQPSARSLDLLIAATAHAHSARLYTPNAEDFHGIKGLVDVVAA